ncbi:MAG: hypothetical protein JNJ78_21910, partial [Anaerolineae bacterium]|nr:hypothetical protein [Anaerolineae bacterium]
AEALHVKTGIDINRRRISQQALREIGTFFIPVRLGTESSPTLKIVVVREDELADYLAGLTEAPPVVQAEAQSATPEEAPVEAEAEAAAEASGE